MISNSQPGSCSIWCEANDDAHDTTAMPDEMSPTTRTFSGIHPHIFSTTTSQLPVQILFFLNVNSRKCESYVLPTLIAKRNHHTRRKKKKRKRRMSDSPIWGSSFNEIYVPDSAYSTPSTLFSPQTQLKIPAAAHPLGSHPPLSQRTTPPTTVPTHQYHTTVPKTYPPLPTTTTTTRRKGKKIFFTTHTHHAHPHHTATLAVLFFFAKTNSGCGRPCAGLLASPGKGRKALHDNATTHPRRGHRYVVVGRWRVKGR